MQDFLLSVAGSSVSQTAQAEEEDDQPPPLPPRMRLPSTPAPRTPDRVLDIPPSLPPKTFTPGPPLPPRRNSQTMNGGTPVIPPRTYRPGKPESLQRKGSNPLPAMSSITPSSQRRELPPPLPPPVTDNPWVLRTPPKQCLISNTTYPLNNDHHKQGFNQPLMPAPRPRPPRHLEEPLRPPRTPPKDTTLSPEELKFFESSY